MTRHLTHETSASSRDPVEAPTAALTVPPDVARDLGRVLGTAVVLFHEAVASRLGLGAAEWRCLELLDREGPATAGRLAGLSGFTTGAITGIVDRLEKAGYVRREPNPRDRRSVIVRPLENPALREQVVPIFQSLGRAMADVAGHYSARELDLIRDYFERTIRALREETTKVSGRAKVHRPGQPDPILEPQRHGD
jgi:DNA-binding MarR family transcriptional regulator